MDPWPRDPYRDRSCSECGHPRSAHSHGLGCLATIDECDCRIKSHYLWAFGLRRSKGTIVEVHAIALTTAPDQAPAPRKAMTA